MGLQGKLEDMPVVDVLQFIYASRRSGTLHLSSRGRRGFIVFRDGNISRASTNAPENTLGAVLLSQKLISEVELAGAVEGQQQAGGTSPLGRILVEKGLVPEARVKEAVIKQIEGAVLDFVLWLDGDFTFELGADAIPPDDVAISVEGILPGVNVNTQHLLLECIRIFDEKNRVAAAEAEAAAPRPAAEVSPPSEIEDAAPPSPSVFLYSDNKALYTLITAVAEKKGLDCVVFRSFSDMMFEIESLVKEDALPVVVLDIDFASGPRHPKDAARAFSLIGKVKKAHGAVEVIAVAANQDPNHRLTALENQARSYVVMPSPPALEAQPPAGDAKYFLRELWTALVASFRNYERVFVKQQWRQRITSLESYLLKVKKFVRDAQRSNFTFMASLDLLNLISENYERALLLLVRDGEAVGIGGFGDAHDGTPLGILAKRLAINLDEPSAFKAVADRKTTFQGKADADLPAHRTVFATVGRPVNGEVIIIPLISGGKTVAMIYCDNGQLDKPLVYDDLLDLLSNQTAILYERMLTESLPRGDGFALGASAGV